MFKLKQKRDLIWVGMAIIFLALLPLLSLAGKETKLYVDDSASGTENGSWAHPYKTISEALKHADKNTTVNVKKGEYKENIEIPKGVKVVGSGSDDVTIKADNDDKAVVKMNNDSEIMKVTIRGGRDGVKVQEGDKALIYKCEIKDNDVNGIYIENGNESKKEEVNISESKITDNGRSGIFSKGRKITLENSEVSGNKGDGIDLGSGSRAWIKNATISNNRGSGVVVEMDDSEIYIRKSSISSNKREGIEINLNSKSGIINLKNLKIKKNSNYGISRVQRSAAGGSFWNGLSVESSVSFLENGKGSISHIFRVF